MSWVIYIYVLVRYSDRLCILCNPTTTLIFELPEEKRHIIQNSDVAWQSYEWLTRDTSAEIREWLEWHSKVLVLNIFLTWKWSWNINWINIWHACTECSYISLIAGILHLRLYTGVFSKSLSEDTTHPRREGRHHQAI